MSDAVKVKSAAVSVGTETGDWMKDSILLSMMTEDGVQVKFDLDVLAAAVLSLTLSPTLEAVKARADQDPRVQEQRRQADLPDDLGGLA